MLIPAVLMYLIYLAKGHYPFGDGCVLVLDLNGQYVWFFEALRNFVKGDASLLYSFSRALGGEFLGIYAYYVASPLSYLLCLFPQNRMLEGLLVLFLLKTALCGGTFGFYMHRTLKRPNRFAIIAFSTFYALTSYAVVQQHNTMWIDAVMWLPLITLGLESLIKYGKFKMYTVFLAITLFSKNESLKDLYFRLRDMLAVVADELKHKTLSFRPMEATHSYQHPKNLNAVLCDDVVLGEIGVVYPAVSKKIDKKASIVYAEIDIPALSRIADAGIRYEETSKYPGMEVDLTFLSETYAPIRDAIAAANSPLLKKVRLVGTYADENGASITVRLTFSCMDRTLTGEEVHQVTDTVIETLAAQGIRLK